MKAKTLQNHRKPQHRPMRGITINAQGGSAVLGNEKPLKGHKIPPGASNKGEM